MYSDAQLYINGIWRSGSGGRFVDIENPATEQIIGRLAFAEVGDLEESVYAADRGFKVWRAVPALDRYRLMRKAADIIRDRAERIAQQLTAEQGKPLAEARAEVGMASEIVDWFAEEARRAYGRVIPSRFPGVQQITVAEPVGPVAAFTPWNFPVGQAVRKISAALAAGCSMIVKASEEAPFSPSEIVRAFADAGLPPGVLNLVFGEPAVISEYLIASPVIRKISFTGSTAVGKRLASLAGEHMKLTTMELGGHAPVIIGSDVDLVAAIKVLGAGKFRNAGQICAAPTRFLVPRNLYDTFVDSFVKVASQIRVGDGTASDTVMGPMANTRRIRALEELTADALKVGAELRHGGKRIGNLGNYFEPTVLTNVPISARSMNEEPFGPIALINSYNDLDEAVSEANRLPYGLAAYAFTNSPAEVSKITSEIQAGMLAVNHLALGLPEIPFGGVKESGHGHEGGTEGLSAYLTTKLVTQKA